MVLQASNGHNIGHNGFIFEHCLKAYEKIEHIIGHAGLI